MTREEKLNGNKLIAEFMGAEIKDDTYCFHLGNPSHSIQVEQMYFEPITRLYYHSSWDWLMPVIQKIAELKYPISLYFSHIQNTTSIHRVNNPYYLVRKSETRRTTPAIEVAYKAVIEFIDEYNKSTQHV